MRIYEIMFIVRPEVPEEELDRLISQFEGVVGSTGGMVQKAEKWGRRRLAYQIHNCREGHYVLFTLECGAATLTEFERRLKVSDQVIKFLTVRTDEEMKRLEKMRRRREKRAARRKAPSAPAPAPAQAAS